MLQIVGHHGDRFRFHTFGQKIRKYGLLKFRKDVQRPDRALAVTTAALMPDTRRIGTLRYSGGEAAVRAVVGMQGE